MNRQVASDARFPKMVTNYEKLAFAFTCFGCPSFSEIIQLCHFYDCDLGKLIGALISLSGKGLVRIIRCSPSLGLYLSIFFALTEVGTSLFRRNYATIMDFLVAPKFWGINTKEAKEMLLSYLNNF